MLSCSKEEAKYEPKPRSDPYKLYQDAYQAFENGDYFYAQKKFSEAELNFEQTEFEREFKRNFASATKDKLVLYLLSLNDN